MPSQVTIIARHHDDFPNIYYTIRQQSSRERQTDQTRLKRLPLHEYVAMSLQPPAPLPSSAAVPTTGSSSSSGSTYSILIIHEGKLIPINNIYDTMMISQVKISVMSQLQLRGSSPRLIYKGKVLKDSDTAVMSKLSAGSKVNLMQS